MTRTRWRFVPAASLLLCTSGAVVTASEGARGELEHQFATTVRPFLEAHCVACHGGEQPEAELNLGDFRSADGAAGRHATWQLILQRLEAEEMPPEDAARQPTADERRAVVDWIRRLWAVAVDRPAGDPGPVLARRLSNAEYNYTIRDLTGVDIRPAEEFPVDPANEAGFDNSGQSLAMSPALLTKYLSAAREVASYLVLKPEGFKFAPHPIETDTDRDKYCVNRIVEFYGRQPTDLADYFQAAWRYRHRAALGQPAASLADVAARQQVRGRYLQLVWDLLTADDAVGPIATLQDKWRALPAGDAEPSILRSGCEAMRDFVVALRAKLAMQFPRLRVRGMHRGSQTLVLWRNRQYAAHRRSFDPSVLSVAGERPAAEDARDTDDEELEEEVQGEEQAPLGDSDLVVPADAAQRARHEAAFARFCSVFPDAFYVSERGREFLDRDEKTVEIERGRLLSAGFHSMMGYFRDDQPLYELILDEPQQRELDALWQELDFIASAPMRQHKGFIWFERTDSRFMISEEFDFARAEDKDATSEAKIKRLAEVYLEKARRNRADEVALGAIRDHFEIINKSIRWVEQARAAAEPSHLDALMGLAERAYRRPLSQRERVDLRDFYRQLRNVDGLDHEQAIRDSVVSVLMSPHFCFRLELAGTGSQLQRLTGNELASRLSYFLWSTMPDARLMERAAAGELDRPEVLVAEARRMVNDGRVRGLAVEFGANWLDFRRFEQHNSVDRRRFPQFSDTLRSAMFEEPVRFFVDLVQRDASVLDFLYSDHTFVNRELAEHYGMSELTSAAEDWARVDGARRYQRGGLLPMAVFQTQNSPGLRTSPVKRGYWVVRRLLGERIPAPPPDVPELPQDEAELGELTLREMLERHREHANCAACHERFDAMGLVFENYGPVGELRSVDLGGRPVDTAAVFPDGTQARGLDGLLDYLRKRRQEEFLDNLCRKLLSYGVGRTLLPSDDATIAQMRTRLAGNDHRFGVLVEEIVTSNQFLTKQGRTTSDRTDQSDPSD